jgi:glutaredoxin-dependent peroxiredoxin
LARRTPCCSFFPLAFTSVCTKELCDLTAGLGGYAGLDADIIGVSVDSPFAQEAWAKQEKIGITLASDLNKTTIKSYNVVFPMLAGVGDTAARAAFVIDKHGVVQYSEQTPTPKDLPNFEAIKAALAKLGTSRPGFWKYRKELGMGSPKQLASLIHRINPLAS